jgi:hypothetical protein
VTSSLQPFLDVWHAGLYNMNLLIKSTSGEYGNGANSLPVSFFI